MRESWEQLTQTCSPGGSHTRIIAFVRPTYVDTVSTSTAGREFKESCKGDAGKHDGDDDDDDDDHDDVQDDEEDEKDAKEEEQEEEVRGWIC